jgi:hypothetical protein
MQNEDTSYPGRIQRPGGGYDDCSARIPMRPFFLLALMISGCASSAPAPPTNMQSVSPPRPERHAAATFSLSLPYEWQRLPADSGLQASKGALRAQAKEVLVAAGGYQTLEGYGLQASQKQQDEIMKVVPGFKAEAPRQTTRGQIVSTVFEGKGPSYSAVVVVAGRGTIDSGARFVVVTLSGDDMAALQETAKLVEESLQISAAPVPAN